MGMSKSERLEQLNVDLDRARLRLKIVAEIEMDYRDIARRELNRVLEIRREIAKLEMSDG